MKISEGDDRRMPESAATSGKMPEKAASRVPSLKKTTTFADQQSAATVKPTLSTAEGKRPIGSPTSTESKADTWEEAEMAKIIKRYSHFLCTLEVWFVKPQINLR